MNMNITPIGIQLRDIADSTIITVKAEENDSQTFSDKEMTGSLTEEKMFPGHLLQIALFAVTIPWGKWFMWVIAHAIRAPCKHVLQLLPSPMMYVDCLQDHN